MRRHATTLVLVALAAIALVFVLVLDRGSLTTGEAELRKRNLIEVWRPDEITELNVTAGGRTARLTRGEPDDAGQRMWSVEIDGQRHAADEQAVDQYLGTLEFAVAERRVSAEAADPAALGLDAPRITVAIAMGARRERVVVGGSAPTPPGAMYAEVAGRGIFVITKQLAAALDTPPERFRSKRFVPYLSTDLAGLHLEGEGGPRRFVRAPWGGSRGAGFRFDGSTPEGAARVQAGALDRALVALGQMQAEVFLSDEEAATAARPAVTVTLLPRDPAAKRAVLEVGGACPRSAAADPGGGTAEEPRRVVAVRREPTRAAACVPAAVLEALAAPARDFVDLGPIGAPLDEIAEVKLGGPRALELARDGSEWHLRAPEDRKIPADPGRSLVQAILDVRASRVVPAGEARGLDPPRATLRVVSTPAAATGEAPAERVEALEIGAPAGDVVHVRRAEDGVILEIPAAAAEALAPSDLALRPRQVLEVRSDRIRALRIQAGGRVQRVRRTDANAWELLEPTGEGLVADLGLASDVADALGSLTAERWVGADAGAGVGLARPRIVIEAEIEEQGGAGPRTVRVEIGAPAASGSFARMGDDPAVFVAPAALEAAAGRLLLSRAVFLVPMDRVARVTLAPDRGDAVEVVRSAGGFTLSSAGKAGAPDETASAALAAGVRDALQGLLAEEAVSLGPPEPHQGLERPRLRVTIALSEAVEPVHARGLRGDEPRYAPEPPRRVRFAIGAGDTLGGTSVVYARRDGVAATYAIAQSKARPLLAAAGLR